MEWEHDDTVRTILRRARVLKVDDSKTQQRMDLAGLAKEKPKEIVKVQPHGFTSHSPKEAEGILMQLAGRGDRSMFFGGEHKDKRPKNLPEGGTAIYDADGKILKMIKDETVLDAGNKPLKIRNASTIQIEGTNPVSFGVAGTWVSIKPGRVDLGVPSAGGSASAAVETTAGPSTIVFAQV